MSAREQAVRDYIVAALREAGAMYENGAREFLAEHDAAVRAEVLREVADFVRDAHFRDGLSVQEIGTGLRFMAGTNTTQET